MRAKDKANLIAGLLVLPFVLLSLLTFSLILANPKARDAGSPGATTHSLKGQHSYTLQSRENLKFAYAGSLPDALRSYYKAWPPLYPIILFFFNRIGIVPLLVNMLMYVLNCVLFYRLLHRMDMGYLAKYFVFIAFLLGTYHFHNLATQIVSEGLFLLMALTILIMLESYARRQNIKSVILLGLITLAAVMTRYFAFFWLLPIVGCFIVALAPNFFKAIKRLSVYAGISILPTIPWFYRIYKITGYFTGWDRFARREIGHLTDFRHNMLYTAKTFYMDFFAKDWASKAEVRADYAIQPWDFIALSACAVSGIAACVCIYRCIARRVSSKNTRIRGLLRTDMRFSLYLLFSFVYLVSLELLWTIGNNDPIYSRFLFPVYPFVILAGAKIYTVLQASKRYLLYTASFYLLFVSIIISQLYRTIVLFLRYLRV